MKEESQIDYRGFIELKETRSWTGGQLKSYPDAFSVCQSYYLSISIGAHTSHPPSLFVQKAKALIPHTDYGESQLIAMSNGEHVSDQSPILFTSMGSFLQ